VLFDAVAILVSPEGATKLSTDATAKDFVSDAFAHQKFIGYNEAASVLFTKAGVAGNDDAGMIQLSKAADASTFIENCRKLRFWEREGKTKMSSL
jgi:catalase